MVHLVTNTLSKMARSGEVKRTGFGEIRITDKGRRTLTSKIGKAQQLNSG